MVDGACAERGWPCGRGTEGGAEGFGLGAPDILALPLPPSSEVSRAVRAARMGYRVVEDAVDRRRSRITFRLAFLSPV